MGRSIRTALVLVIAGMLMSGCADPQPVPSPSPVEASPAEPSASPSPSPSPEKMPVSQARVEGTYSGATTFIAIKAACAEGPCSGKLEVPGQGSLRLQRRGTRYFAQTRDKMSVPGPGPKNVITTNYILKPVLGEWIDGTWKATAIVITQDIEVESPAFTDNGVRIPSVSRSTKDTSRAFLEGA